MQTTMGKAMVESVAEGAASGSFRFRSYGKIPPRPSLQGLHPRRHNGEVPLTAEQSRHLRASCRAAGPGMPHCDDGAAGTREKHGLQAVENRLEDQPTSVRTPYLWLATSPSCQPPPRHETRFSNKSSRPDRRPVSRPEPRRTEGTPDGARE